MVVLCKISSWYKAQPPFSRALWNFVAVSLLLTLFFWGVRCGIMTERDYSRKQRDGLEHPVWEAFYQSIMTQTTIGASDLSAISIRAQVLDGIQGLSTFFSLAILALFYGLSKQSPGGL